MKFLRTPDSCFENVPDYPFDPRYVELNEIRMHYVESGPADGPVMLLLHGEPSWSFLYRKMIPPLAAAGFRVVAPDLIGFGKSDKPVDAEAYSYQSHMDWMTLFVRKLDLTAITLFCQDWGGLLGLRLAAEHPDRFARICAANTFLPTGDIPATEAFLAWQNFALAVKRFPIGRIIKNSCVTPPADDVVAAYNAPFPDESYKMGARRFPALVPIRPDDPASEANRFAWANLRAWTKPFLTLFSDSDPITRGGELLFRRYIPGAKDQKHEIIEKAGHFLQEDKGELIAEKLVRWT